MQTQIQIEGTYPHSFTDKNIELTGSNHILIDSDTTLVKVRYQGPAAFTGGAIRTEGGWTIHTFTQTGFLNEI